MGSRSMIDKWYYEPDENNSVRHVLGTKGDNH
jgi:hypothetical protein